MRRDAIGNGLEVAQLTADLEALAGDIVRSALDLVYAIGPVTFFKVVKAMLAIMAISSDSIALGIAQASLGPVELHERQRVNVKAARRLP